MKTNIDLPSQMKFGYLKYIFAILGFFIDRFEGAFVGMLIGFVVDSAFRAPEESTYNDDERPSGPPAMDNNFIRLAACVLKAKPMIMEKERAYFRQFLLRFYGSSNTAEYMSKLDTYFNQKFNHFLVAKRVSEDHNYRTRLRLFEFYYGLAASDAELNAIEERILFDIARGLDISRVHYENVKASYHNRFNYQEFYKTQKASPASSIAYYFSILGISENAQEAEIKAAYRKGVLKYHPDRGNFENEAEKKKAEEKFNQLTDAYERIRKYKNIK